MLPGYNQANGSTNRAELVGHVRGICIHMNSEGQSPKRRYWLWGVEAIFVGIIVAFLFQLFGPNPRIIVSKETTFITAPLREDGLPDYQKYWRDLGREGVTPENNGAVLFWQAIWPGRLSQRDFLPVSNALGFERIPDSANTLQDPNGKAVRESVGLWLTERYQAGLSVKDSNNLLWPDNQRIILRKADELIGLAMERPWTSEQAPPLVDWVQRNEEPLDLLVEASKRPRWWSPSPSLLGDRYEGIISIELPGAQNLPQRRLRRYVCERCGMLVRATVMKRGTTCRLAFNWLASAAKRLQWSSSSSRLPLMA